MTVVSLELRREAWRVNYLDEFSEFIREHERVAMEAQMQQYRKPARQNSNGPASKAVKFLKSCGESPCIGSPPDASLTVLT